MVNTFNQKDYPEIKMWHSKRGTPAPDLEDLPLYGLIKKGVAAGFLIITDCRLGLLDYYISNPDALRGDRSEALDQITQGLLDYGRKFGLKHFKADTIVDAIGNRALKNGFQYTGEYKTFFMRG